MQKSRALACIDILESRDHRTKNRSWRGAYSGRGLRGNAVLSRRRALGAARGREPRCETMADCIDLTVDSDDEARRKREAPAPAPAPARAASAETEKEGHPRHLLRRGGEEEESTAAAPVAAPVPASAAPAPAAAPDEEPKEPKEPPKCKTCGAPCELRTARSAKNDGRR